MPKVKTRKSIINRFRITKNGKVMRRQSFRGHLNEHKSKKRLRNLKRVKELTNAFAKKIRKALGK